MEYIIIDRLGKPVCLYFCNFRIHYLYTIIVIVEVRQCYPY
nr:MAG TPA: hypothetical protein [Caudoviricetes sp.]